MPKFVVRAVIGNRVMPSLNRAEEEARMKDYFSRQKPRPKKIEPAIRSHAVTDVIHLIYEIDGKNKIRVLTSFHDDMDRMLTGIVGETNWFLDRVECEPAEGEMIPK
ncbi:hypothetical protein ACFL2D_00695 [Patescibacteria group bacterium]